MENPLIWANTESSLNTSMQNTICGPSCVVNTFTFGHTLNWPIVNRGFKKTNAYRLDFLFAVSCVGFHSVYTGLTQHFFYISNYFQFHFHFYETGTYKTNWGLMGNSRRFWDEMNFLKNCSKNILHHQKMVWHMFYKIR